MDETARYELKPLRYSRVDAAVPLIVALTVGASSYVFEAGNATETAIIFNAYSTNSGTSDGLAMGANGTDALGRWVHVNESLTTYGIRSNSLTQYLQTTSRNNSSINFQIGTGPGATGFNALGVYNPIVFTVNGVPATLPAPEPVPDPTPAPDPSPVPEPATAMLFGVGLLGVAALRRRMSRR